MKHGVHHMCFDGDVRHQDECTCKKNSGQMSLNTVTNAGVPRMTCVVQSSGIHRYFLWERG